MVYTDRYIRGVTATNPEPEAVMENRVAINLIKSNRGVTLHKVYSGRVLITACKSGYALWVDDMIQRTAKTVGLLDRMANAIADRDIAAS